MAENDKVEEEKEESKGEKGDKITKDPGASPGEEMEEMEFDYAKMAREMKKVDDEVLSQKQVREREIDKSVGQRMKDLDTSLDLKFGQMKSGILEEIKGLPKDEAKKLVDEQIAEKCKNPDDPLCQALKEIAKTTVAEAIKGGKGTGEIFEMPTITEEYRIEFQKLNPEQRAKLQLIPHDSHETMMTLLDGSDKSRKGLNKRIFERLTEGDLKELLTENPQLVTKLPGALCTTPGCTEVWNKAVEENPEIKPEEKKHWLLKPTES